MTDRWKKYLTDHLPEAEAVIAEYEQALIDEHILELTYRVDPYEVTDVPFDAMTRDDLLYYLDDAGFVKEDLLTLVEELMK